MVQLNTNGSSDATFVTLTPTLNWFIVDEASRDTANANVALFGFTGAANDPNPGEVMLRNIATIANPVILEGGNASIAYIGIEARGVTAAMLETALQLHSEFSTMTVTAATLTLV